MIMNKNSIWFLSGYGIALILFLYYGLNGLIVNTTGNTFPNAKFMTILVLVIIVTWSMGLGVRHYLNSFTKDLRNKFKNYFLGITMISWIIVTIIFSVTWSAVLN